MKGVGLCIRGRSSEPSVNNEASSRAGNGVLLLEARFLQYRLMANPRDKKKSIPALPAITPPNVPASVRRGRLKGKEGQ